MSGFRGSNLTKTMANLQDLESFESLHPLTPPIQILAIYFVFSGKLLVNSNLQFLFLGQAIGEFSRGRVRRTVHCSQAKGRLHTTRKMVFYSLVSRCAYSFLLGIAPAAKNVPSTILRPKKPFAMVLRAQIHGFGNLFCVFWQAIGKFQFLVPVIPSYWGNHFGRF